MTSIRGLKIPATDEIKGQGVRIGIVKSMWNDTVVNALVDGSILTLKLLGVTDITIETVGGAFELPLAAQAMAQSKRFEAIIAIGCLIKGETMHFEYISSAAVDGLMRVGLETGVPVINGVLNVLTESQALARAGLEGTHGNEGIGWAKTAVMQSLLVSKYSH
jgi:6,7-dimethyl-8-ribityllumazine synthase